MELLALILTLLAIWAFLVILDFITHFIKFIYYKLKKVEYTAPEMIISGNYQYIKVILFLIGFYHIIMSTFFTNTQIGSFYEKSEYSEKYYVYLTYNKNDVKFYKLPADIHSSIDEYEDYDGTIHSYRNYFLTKVYWPNGNILEFDYLEIEPEEQCSLSDIKGNDYYIELTKNKVE